MATKKKPARHLAPREWKEIEFLWARGDHTLKELSKRFGVRPDTISTKMKERGVVKGQESAAAMAEFESELEKKQRKFAEQRAERILQTREELFMVIRALTLGIPKVYQEAQRTGTAFGDHLHTIKAYVEAIKGVKMGREELYALLNYDPKETDGEDIPQLVVREMTDDEINEILRRQEEEDAALTAELEALKEE